MPKARCRPPGFEGMVPAVAGLRRLRRPSRAIRARLVVAVAGIVVLAGASRDDGGVIGGIFGAVFVLVFFFAYRMICKDTIEDKIIHLQEKKRALAKELITDDEGFVKSLSREDVEYLFS